MSGRRSPLELYRDALLILAMETLPMKRTRFMYGLQMSWTPFMRLLDDLTTKKLISRISPEEYLDKLRGTASDRRSYRRGRPDARTKYYVEITMKGQYVLRWLDELLKYIMDESSTAVRPPIWILQTLFRHRIEDLKIDAPDPFTALQRPLDVKMQGLEFKLLPVYMYGSQDLLAEFVVNHPIPFVKALELKDWDEELKAEFEVKKKRVIKLFCPKCGKEAKDLRGMKIHIGRMHREEKKQLWANVEFHLKLQTR